MRPRHRFIQEKSLSQTMVYLVSAGLLVPSFLAMMELPGVLGAKGFFGGGNGTRASPYIVEDALDLQAMVYSPFSCFVLGNDIDVSDTVNWNAGLGFFPIGSNSNKFSGSLDGKNHTISGLFIRRSADYIGLFGCLNVTGSVKDIWIVDSDVAGSRYTGGLIGWNLGMVSGASFAGKVTGTQYAGGLVGYDYYGTLRDSHSAGTVDGTEDVGGLVGYTEKTMLTNVSSSCGVSGSSVAGGLIGYSYGGRMENSSSTGNVFVTAGCAGGLIGQIYEGSVNNCFATGNVTGDAIAGGLVGADDWGTIANSHASGNVSAGSYVGGLVGMKGNGAIGHSNATGNVTATADVAGGLVGENSHCQINWSFATGTVRGGNYSAGGLIGENIGGPVRGCFATGNVTGMSLVGGLVGDNWEGLVCGSFATGDVNGGGDHVGGLVGRTTGSVADTYARGNVTGNKTTGGLAGYNSGHVNCSYSTGKVKGVISPGGLIGACDGNASRCFWDVETSGIAVSARGTGATTARMKNRDTFSSAGWGFSDTWAMIWDKTYPFFRWQDKESPVAEAGPDQTVDQGTFVQFDGRGSKDDIGIAYFHWSFEDGRPMTLMGTSPTHQFFTPGRFVVELEVEDAVRRTATDIVNITVLDTTPPIAEAGPDQAVNEDTLVRFDGSASSDNVGVANYTWSLYEGRPVALHEVRTAHFFQNPGIYNVSLTVTDAAGNRDSDTLNVRIWDTTAPVAECGPDITCDEGANVTLDASGSHDNVGIANYTWTFFDIRPVTIFGVQPAYRFDNPGLFVVRLDIADSERNAGQDNMTVTVRDIRPPDANAGPDQTVAAGTNVSLDGSNSTDNVGVAKYLWNFTYDGQRTSLEGKTIHFLFERGGTYEMKLTSIDLAGNQDTDSAEVTVVDTGIVNGTVLDQAGRPVEGANVRVESSDGLICTGTTDSNGSFSQKIHHGPFSCNITKAGYEGISGNYSVGPMSEASLNFYLRPLEKTKGAGASIQLPLLALAIIVVAACSAGYVLIMKRKKKKAM